MEEISTFASYYFGPDIPCKRNRRARNDEGVNVATYSIFNYPGRGYGQAKLRSLTDLELAAAYKYILLNCKETAQYYEEFTNTLCMYDADTIARMVDEKFTEWFREFVSSQIMVLFHLYMY